MADPSAVESTIRFSLERLKIQAEEQNGQVVALSSIAAGSDTLFAQQAEASGISWKALLPMDPKEFRSDFTESEWAQANSCLEHTKEIKITPSLSPDRMKDPDVRNQAYLDAGLQMVDNADLLLSVWDGQPARGRGGTAEIIEYAKKQGKQVFCISPTGEIVEDGWKDIQTPKKEGPPPIKMITSLPSQGSFTHSTNLQTHDLNR